jgi:putative oxidoreductase
MLAPDESRQGVRNEGEEPMSDAAEPRLLFPQLKPFYDKVEPLSWLLVRLTAGLMIIPHGWPKLMMGIEATAQMALVRRGIEPAWPLAVGLITLETLGGLCVALGLFTRFWAAAIAIEMAVIVYHHLGGGFGWTNRGYEYPVLWGLIMLGIALRGGGPYSLDRRVGKQL